MQWVYEHFGDALYKNIKPFKAKITEHIKHNEIKIKPAQLKELLDIKIWNKQKAITEQTSTLKGKIGTKQFDDFNLFEPLFEKTIEQLELELDSKDKKQILDAICWKNPDAERVIKKSHAKKKDKKELYGYFLSKNKQELIEYKVDTDLRDYENIPLKENIEIYFKREVLPHVSDAWIDANKRDEKDDEIGIVGYEIPFNRHFYEYQPPRPLEEIDQELDKVSKEIMGLLKEIHS